MDKYLTISRVRQGAGLFSGYEGMTTIGKKVLMISENEINEMSGELENLYPMEVSVYYEECIYAMQEHMKKF